MLDMHIIILTSYFLMKFSKEKKLEKVRAEWCLVSPLGFSKGNQITGSVVFPSQKTTLLYIHI